MTLSSHLFADLVRKPVGIGVQRNGVPLISGVSEHQTLVARAHVEGVTNSLGDLLGLGLDVKNNVHVVAVQANLG